MANDFRQFQFNLDEFARKIRLAPARVAKRVAFDLFGLIVRKTPVDTGRAQGSWTMSLNAADRRVQPDNLAAYPTPQPGPAVALMGPTDTIWISNNLPYITALEDGHSKQAPAGMVALSIVEVQAKMDALMQAGMKDAGL